MSEIKIETLTAVHIGSGETLRYGTDFVQGNFRGKNVLGIIDARKVMALIGKNNIDKWVYAIEQGEPTDSIIKVYASNAEIKDYSKRIIFNFAEVKNQDTLKEHIHDGRGKPYIPGTSIKGAMRTAVLSSVIAAQKDTKRYEDMMNVKISAKQVEGEIFGKDPSSDIFRFLQIGDAYFGETMYEIALRMVNINERKHQSFWDISKSQLIEAICSENESTFQMKLNLMQYVQAKDQVHSLPACMRSIPDLFMTINEHTKTLIEREIRFWEERSLDDESESVIVYLEKMNEIKTEAEQCENGKSCVLRIGHGSGWRFITGAWTETFSNFYSEIVPKARPSNQKYEEYEFPKTRRIDEDCDLMGFVRLTKS